MNLGETIYRLRTGRNMSQGDLAEVLDVSRQSVSKWENNMAVPDLDKLVKMSELFGITLDELVTGKAPKASTVTHFSLPDVLSLVLFILSILCFSVLSILAPIIGFHDDVGILYGLTLLLSGIAVRCNENLSLCRRLIRIWIPVFCLFMVCMWFFLPLRYPVFAGYWGAILLCWKMYLRWKSSKETI